MTGRRLGHRTATHGARGLIVVAVLTALLGLVQTPASAAPGAKTTHAAASGPYGQYLALGDSVAFGYRPPQVTTTQQYLDPTNFKSYADDIAAAQGLSLTNASCPGETTSSFLDATAQSNGCENSVGPGGTTVAAGYRTVYPLHTSYTGSQLAYAISFLQAHPDTRLVTLTLGANDAFVCEAKTTDSCASELPATLQTIATNLATIYRDLRTEGGYQGRIVTLGYYSTSYTDPTMAAEAQALNATIQVPTVAAGGTLANGYAAFEQASAPFGHDPCAAGLLVALPAGGCNIHPTPRGHELLARAFGASLATGPPLGSPGYLLASSDGGVTGYGGAPSEGSLAGGTLHAPVVAVAETPDGGGYWLTGADGSVFSFGDATSTGSEAGHPLNAPIVGMVPTPGGGGYWLVAADGGVFSFGDAHFFGSEGGSRLNQPVVGMAATPDGNGYWLVAADGGIFTFGDAPFLGSEGGQRLTAPVVGMSAAPDGRGYWLASADGGVVAFADAQFAGSAAGSPLGHPVVGIAVPS